MVLQQNPTDFYSILRLAQEQIIELAAEVGVDGQAVLANLPAPGHLWRGASVPVQTKSYRGSCSVLFHVNHTRSGFEWPLLRFHTFKNGGNARTFNGMQWLSQNQELRKVPPASSNIFIRQQMHQTREHLEDAARLSRFRQVHREYSEGTPLSAMSDWLIARLSGEATSNLCARVKIRQHGSRLLVPLETANGSLTGYQSIFPTAYSDQKRFWFAQSGLLNGSFFRVQPSDYEAEPSVLICEGVATALSLALVWQGEIRAALTATNLAAVRAEVKGKAVFAHDMDIYKPHVGNVGLIAARAAMASGDSLLTPRFHFDDLVERPTDFNDVLTFYGVDELYRQIRCRSSTPE